MSRQPTRPTVGPRGGRAIEPTPCSECVSWRSCKPGVISEPFGCESWVNDEGRRALPDLLEPEAKPVDVCRNCAQLDYCDNREPGATLDSGCCWFILKPILANPDPAPEPDQDESDAPCPCDDPDCSRPWGHDALSDPEPEPFRPTEAYAPDPSRGEAPAQAVLPMPDAGPLFAGCLEAKS